MDDTYKLIESAKNKDKDSLEILINRNTGLIWSIINKMKFNADERDDIFQVAVMGFIKAVYNFNTTLNYRLSTYAVYVISGEIKKYVRENSIIKISRKYKSIFYKFNRERENYIKKNGTECSINDIAEIINEKPEDIIVAINANDTVDSLDKTISEDDRTYYEKIECESSNPELYVERLTLQQSIEQLEPIEQKIIRLRYVCNKTQKQTGEILNISQVQVSRLEKKVLLKMRKLIV